MAIDLESLTRAFGQARQDLADVRLLSDGEYLDRIECRLAAWPGGWWDQYGFFIDRPVGFFGRLVGFEAGSIYVFFNAPAEAHKPGSTLTDVVRHEFAHAWYWLDHRFVGGPWFREAFGGSYTVDAWEEDDEEELWDADEYVSDYAMTCPREDFAETFMTFLHYRKSLSRFRSRPGVYRKLRAVRDAVRRAAAERAGRVRGPQ